jgi:hypothetical protein
MLFAAFLFTLPVQATLSWDIQTVDESVAGTGNGYCPIVMDSNNLPHIAYTGVAADSTGDMTLWVRYASWNGTVWNTQTVAEGRAYSIVLDKNGNPYILYGGINGLMYAYWNGYNWIPHTVDAEANGADFGVIVFDSLGTMHVAYTDGTNIKYASGSGSNWNIQTIDKYDPGTVPLFLSFQLNTNNTPYIMYYTPGSYLDENTGVAYRSLDVKLAINQNSKWNTENVTLPFPASFIGNLILDSHGNPHLIYVQNHYASGTYTATSKSLLYARWNGQTWETQTVVSTTDFAYNWGDSPIEFLTLDSADRPHICYISSSSEVTYVSQINDDVWKTQIVGNSVNSSARWPCYMVLDTNNNPHISYLAGSDLSSYIANLMYATANTTTEAVPSETVIPLLPTPEGPTAFADLPLLLGLATIFVVTGVILVYVWIKKH